MANEKAVREKKIYIIAYLMDALMGKKSRQSRK